MAEALRLADALDADMPIDLAAVAAELRRLHTENEAARLVGIQQERDLMKAKAQRDALLEALKEIVDAADGKGWEQLDPSFKKARAAIKAVEGEKR